MANNALNKAQANQGIRQWIGNNIGFKIGKKNSNTQDIKETEFYKGHGECGVLKIGKP
jgi:hypothetical protein